jgi:hypothetical protein
MKADNDFGRMVAEWELVSILPFRGDSHPETLRAEFLGVPEIDHPVT